MYKIKLYRRNVFMEDIKLTNKSTKSGSEETQEELKENNEKMKSVKEYGNTTMAVPNERIQVLDRKSVV